MKKWCEEHHVSVKIYYRWKRLYIAQAASQTKGSNSAGILSGEIPLMHSQFCCR